MNEALTPPLSLEDESSELSESEIFYDPEALSSAEQMQHDADSLKLRLGLWMKGPREDQSLRCSMMAKESRR